MSYGAILRFTEFTAIQFELFFFTFYFREVNFIKTNIYCAFLQEQSISTDLNI